MLPPADFEVQDFHREVVLASNAQPVLVDFWAPWCGPCRTLGPVLESLAQEADGRWTLVKVNTDEHPDLMQQFGIRGIPAVKLFVEGEVAAEFTGALPEFVLRRWLDEHVPSPVRKQLDEAHALIAQDEPAAARAVLERVIPEAEGPDRDEAREALARLVVFGDPAWGDGLVEGIHTPVAEGVRSVAALLRRDPEDLPEGDARDAYAAALQALKSGDLDAALDGLVALVRSDRAYGDDAARKAAVALFAVLGEGHPVVKTHRPTFNASLY